MDYNRTIADMPFDILKKNRAPGPFLKNNSSFSISLFSVTNVVLIRLKIYITFEPYMANTVDFTHYEPRLKAGRTQGAPTYVIVKQDK